MEQLIYNRNIFSIFLDLLNYKQTEQMNKSKNKIFYK